MKKTIIWLVVVALAVAMAFIGMACEAPAEITEEAEPAEKAKVIGYYMDAADDYYKAGYEVFEALAKEQGWEVIGIVGQGTAPEQLTAVENFITQKVDAIVCVQNSPQTTSECLTKANSAGVPYFALTHNPPDELGLTGFSGFDWVLNGKYSGESAVKYGVKNAIIIEGKLGQGAAAGQTQGFLEAYKEAGKDIGDLLESVGIKGAGGADLQVVFWGSGGWFADPAKKAMQDAVTSLGPDGFDGAYVENDEMMTGALQAMQEAGLDTSNYWLGASNGKEKSWDWVEKGTTTADINQPPTLEADLVFQQIKAFFEDKPFKKAVYAYMLPFEKDNMDRAKLVPWVFEDYMAKRKANAFMYDINDSLFKENPSYK